MKAIKWLYVAAGLCLTLPAAAQTGKLVKNVAAGMEAAAKRAASSARLSAAGRFRARLPEGRFSLSAAAVERYIFQPVTLTPFSRLQFNFDEAPYEWMLEKGRQYEEVMAAFKDFKTEADVFLYYQSKTSERRALHSEEVAYWREKIDAVQARLGDLCWGVSADDPAVSQAFEYMAYVKWALYPHAKDLYFAKPLPPRTDRVFSQDEFFLRDPFTRPVKRWEFASSRARRIARELPPGLRVAVVNDMVYYRKHLSDLASKGLLFPDGKLDVFANAEELLSALRAGRAKFDVIFTDIIIAGEGGGGYYLASELRSQGYDGAIIALSSYEEDAALGQQMFERGLDGMIRMDGGLLYKKDWSANMTQKLLNYFYYRDLNGWNY